MIERSCCAMIQSRPLTGAAESVIQVTRITIPSTIAKA
jgi:hypothetical protein